MITNVTTGTVIEGPFIGSRVIASPSPFRVIGRDFPHIGEPATVAEVYTALGMYEVALSECDALLAEARISYRVGWQARLLAYKTQLIEERQLWRDALPYALRKPPFPRATSGPFICDGCCCGRQPVAPSPMSTNRYAVGTNREAKR